MDLQAQDKLIFEAQWHQPEASVTHEFILSFYTQDNSLELVNNSIKVFEPG